MALPARICVHSLSRNLVYFYLQERLAICLFDALVAKVLTEMWWGFPDETSEQPQCQFSGTDDADSLIQSTTVMKTYP